MSASDAIPFAIEMMRWSIVKGPCHFLLLHLSFITFVRSASLNQFAIEIFKIIFNINGLFYRWRVASIHAIINESLGHGHLETNAARWILRRQKVPRILSFRNKAPWAFFKWSFKYISLMDLCSLNEMLFPRNFLSLAHKHTCMQNVPTNNDLLYSITLAWWKLSISISRNNQKLGVLLVFVSYERVNWLKLVRFCLRSLREGRKFDLLDFLPTKFDR